MHVNSIENLKNYVLKVYSLLSHKQNTNKIEAIKINLYDDTPSNIYLWPRVRFISILLRTSV